MAGLVSITSSLSAVAPPIDFEERRSRRKERVAQLERRLKRIQRNRKQREWRRNLRPLRNMVVLVVIGALAWVFLPRLFSASSPADAIAQAREDARREVEDLQDEILADVSDAIGIEIERPNAPISLDGAVVDGWAAPLDRIDADRATRPHHTYAAWDYGTRVGTPVYAMTDGRVVRATDDDGARCGGMVILSTERERAQITYCHLSDVLVTSRDDVRAGELIGLTGGKPGARGAGRSSGPHLHLQIKLDGTLRCPQAQLVALNAGRPLDVRDLPEEGCWYDSAPFRLGTGQGFGLPDQEIDLDDPLVEWDP